MAQAQHVAVPDQGEHGRMVGSGSASGSVSGTGLSAGGKGSWVGRHTGGRVGCAARVQQLLPATRPPCPHPTTSKHASFEPIHHFSAAERPAHWPCPSLTPTSHPPTMHPPPTHQPPARTHPASRGDQHDASMVEYFLTENLLAHFTQILQQRSNRRGDVATQALQTLSILIQNVRNQQTVYYLFSNNHINEVVSMRFDFEDDEVLVRGGRRAGAGGWGPRAQGHGQGGGQVPVLQERWLQRSFAPAGAYAFLCASRASPARSEPPQRGPPAGLLRQPAQDHQPQAERGHGAVLLPAAAGQRRLVPAVHG